VTSLVAVDRTTLSVERSLTSIRVNSLTRWKTRLTVSKPNLIAGNFVIPSGFQELDAVRDRFWNARSATVLALTLTATLDCNLGCYYCYEDRSEARLDTASVADIAAWTRTRLLESGKKTLHVDWYGDEPLLNQTFIETASTSLQQLCMELEVAYSASIISNGTCWPSDVGSFIRRHKIRQAQISFDGMQRNHDQRRRFRDKTSHDSSFDLAVATVDQLLDFVRVDVRINIDRKNETDVLPFVELAQSRGWFQRKFPAVIQPALLAAYTDSSAFMRKSELSVSEYDELRAAVREKARGNFAVEESEVPEGFPVPRSSVCAALAHDSVVVGADRKLYRCGLQVSEPHRAVGVLRSETGNPLPILGQQLSREAAQSAQKVWWSEFDPTKLPSCSRCSFLPICWVAVPRNIWTATSTLSPNRALIGEEIWLDWSPRALAGNWIVPRSLPSPINFVIEQAFSPTNETNQGSATWSR
jgi:uncharacterized protein